MIDIIFADGKKEYEAIEMMKSRASEIGANIETTAKQIMDDI